MSSRRAAIISAVLLCVAAVARADHGFGDEQLDDVDDEPLAQELRAAFGARISTCTPDGACALSLTELSCKGSVCRARDAAHGGKRLVARGAAAKTVREHLLDLGSSHFAAGQTAAWEVQCHAEKGSNEKIRHGHCGVTLGDGDGELIGGVSGFGSNKLGGVWWTGDVIVTCGDGICHAQCAHGRLFLQYQDCEGDPRDFPRTRAFAEALARRGGASAALISCGGWRDQGWDGGLVDVAGCKVGPLPAAPPVPRPWATLVRPDARWELVGDGGAHLTVETDDVRAIGDAQVARLRGLIDGDVVDMGRHGLPAQVAVTAAGIWFLDGDDDDAAIAHTIATTPPTYADVPALTEPSAVDFARVWRTGAGVAYCVGHRDPQRDCEPDTCNMACFAPDAGVVLLTGDDAPRGYMFSQAGWTD
jgi:hypothetical protein